MAGMRTLFKLPSFNNVAPDITSSLTAPLGMKYDKLFLVATEDGTDLTAAEFASHVKELRVVLDGDTKIQVSGAQLQAINAFYKEPFNDGVLVLNLSRPWLRTVQGEENTGYGTRGVQTFLVEIDWEDSVTITGELKASMYAEQSKNELLGQHYTIRRFTSNAAVIGADNDLDNLPRGKFFATAMHLITGTVTQVKVEANQREIFNGTKPVIQARYGSKRAVQSGYVHIDFAHTNQSSHALIMDLYDFRIKYTSTGAGSFPVLVERIEGVIAA